MFKKFQSKFISFSFLSLKNNMIKHASGYCMELSAVNDKDIFMSVCDVSNAYQKWSWKKRIHNATATH